MEAILIEVSEKDGVLKHNISTVPFKDKIKLDDMYKLIGCRLIGIEETREYYSKVGTIRPLSMVFDDEFLLHDEAIPNIIASSLYGVWEHGNVICGNVLLCDVDTEGNSIGFSEQEANDIAKTLDKLLVPAVKIKPC